MMVAMNRMRSRSTATLWVLVPGTPGPRPLATDGSKSSCIRSLGAPTRLRHGSLGGPDEEIRRWSPVSARRCLRPCPHFLKPLLCIEAHAFAGGVVGVDAFEV